MQCHFTILDTGANSTYFVHNRRLLENPHEHSSESVMVADGKVMDSGTLLRYHSIHSTDLVPMFIKNLNDVTSILSKGFMGIINMIRSILFGSVTEIYLSNRGRLN